MFSTDLFQLSETFRYPFWDKVLLGNTVETYVAALLALGVFLLAFKLLQFIILRKLRQLAKRTDTDIDDVLVRIVGTLRPPFYFFLAFYLAIQFLALNSIVDAAVNVILVVWVTAQVVIAVQILIDYAMKKAVDEDDEHIKAASGAIKTIAKGVLWALGLLLVLSNFGIDITSLVAGLGIGGIAVALALQNILSDLFSSFSIYFDKPFVPGDFIIVGGDMGTVEKIGIKTTRLRALQGEELIISNKELTSARIQNYKDMQERRIVFQFGVVYETPAETLRRIPELVSGVINHLDNTRTEYANFKSFDDSALTYEVAYYVTSGEYTEYMQTQEHINIGIKEQFEKERITMAYPTRTLYLHQPSSGGAQ